MRATSRVGGHYYDRDDEMPKMLLQSMHRVNSLRQCMSTPAPAKRQRSVALSSRKSALGCVRILTKSELVTGEVHHRGGDRYSMDVLGLAAAPSFPPFLTHDISTGASQSPIYGSGSSDLLAELSSNDVSKQQRRLQVNSRGYWSDYSAKITWLDQETDYRMPDAYMSGLSKQAAISKSSICRLPYTRLS
uniref:Uncharacterized protein n=1 Tax=Hyaloperonospora arabidopsidis (strain Emoy2) TaxID=559515 RepID=M4BCL1_HYAAE